MNKKNDNILHELIDLLKSALISIIVVIVLTNFVFKPIEVYGPSSLPTIREGQIGLSSIITLQFRTVRRFEFVIFPHLDETGQIRKDSQGKSIFLVKRVIGLPNETIEFRNDRLYVNGEFVDEPFLDNPLAKEYKDRGLLFTQNFGPITLGEDELFVVGDNRRGSSDSRGDLGPIKVSDVESVGLFILFPFEDFGVVK
ncbi:MAG: signal peptidase I [Erysipelotrichia bacterium]|jgi:signal peptidase I|nr:signal peptidase I [Erysipelotrichia bacterium]